jgi:Caspase domain
MVALPQPDLSRAVLIGTSLFDRLPDLPAVRNNLTELHRSLTDPDSGILPTANCSIVDSPETTSRFMRRLRAVAQQAEDFLLVYYSGHGLRHETRDLLYLAVQDTDPDGPEGTAVRFDSLREIIESSPARTRLLVLDCCYSGMALGAMSSGTIDSRDVAIGGTAVITSSPKNKISHSPPGEQFTAFTGEFITLLKNGSRIPGEPLTVGTAFRSLQAALARRDLPEPKLKVTDTGSDMLLRRTPPPPPKPPTPKPPIPQAVRPTQSAGPIRPARPVQSQTFHRLMAQPIPKPEPTPAPRPVAKPELRVVASARPVPRLPEPAPPQRPQPPLPAVSIMPTVPVLRPVERPAPPAQEKRKRADLAGRVIKALLADGGWLLLWIACCMSTGYGIGGTVAVIAEPTSDQHFGSDLGAAIVGPIIGVGCGFLIARRVARRRKRGLKSPSLTARMPMPVLIACGAVCALFVVVGLISTSSGTAVPTTAGQATVSNLAVGVAVELFLSAGVLICGLEFYRRRRGPQLTASVVEVSDVSAES